MISRWLPDSFSQQLFLLLSGVLLTGSIGWWGYSAYQVEDVLTRQIALRAQVQARSLAQLPELIAAVEAKHSVRVSTIIDSVQSSSDADFITVSDNNSIRLAHPRKDRIGLPVMGGDTAAALKEGKSYLSYGTGSLGASVRFITPVRNENGTVVGMVKVGYLIDTVEMWSSRRLLPLLLFGILVVVLSLILTQRFSAYVRKNMQNMEPWQLKQALLTHQGVLQATHEGLLAVNAGGQAYVVNESARQLLNVPHEQSLPTAIAPWLDDPACFSLSGPDYIDRLVRINGKNCVITRVTLAQSQPQPGAAVFSLRAYEELQALSDTLSQTGQYIESLRVTRHEYQNQLSILSGLLQMGHYQAALNMTLNQARNDQRLLDHLKGFEAFPQLNALLLGKILRAKEKQIALHVSADGVWRGLPVGLKQEQLCIIVGNLLDNSMDAVDRVAQGYIEFSMWESAREFGLSVSNNGPQVTLPLELLTQLHFTTKPDCLDHGIGLHLVQSCVAQADGHIELDSDAVETSFTLYFAKGEDSPCLRS